MPAREPGECHTEWVKAFNAGDLDGLMEYFEEDCVVVPQPGQVLTGAAAARQAMQGFLAFRGTMDMRPRRVLQAGGVALLVSDWTLTGTGPDGSPATLGGTTTDVVRRQRNGTWRYAIDSPLGVQGV